MTVAETAHVADLHCTLHTKPVVDAYNRFQEFSGLLTSPDGVRAVKQYNRIARTLTEFELLWTDAWTKSVDAAQARLRAPLLVRHPETGVDTVENKCTHITMTHIFNDNIVCVFAFC